MQKISVDFFRKPRDEHQENLLAGQSLADILRISAVAMMRIPM
jgi:hypothetical protein